MKLSHFFVFLFFLLLIGVVSAVKWSEVYDSTASEIRSFAVFENKLYAGSTGGKVFVFDGSTWSESYNLATNISSLAVFEDKLYAGSSSEGKVFVFDGSTWSESYASSENRIYSLAVFEDKLYAGIFKYSYPSYGKIFVFDGSTWSESYDSTEHSINSLVVFNNKLYAGTGTGGKVFVFNGSTWSESYDSTESYIYSFAVFENKLYAGSTGGKVFVFDGSTWSESYDSTESHIYSFAVFEDKLYAGTANNGKIFVGNKPNIHINRPIDESTGEPISEDWKVTITGAIQDIDENVSTSTYENYVDSNLLAGQTIQVTVEDNTNSYYSRQYHIKVVPDMDIIIQPYLVPVESGISYSVKVLDSVTLLPVGNVKLDIFAEVPGETEKKLVESIITEDKGIGVLSGITLKNYDIHAYYDGVLLTTKTNSVTSNQVYLGLNLYVYSEGGFDLISAYSNLTPSETIVDSKDLNLTFENTASIPMWYNVKIISIDTETNEEKNVLIDKNYFENNFDINSSELNWVNDDYNMLKIRVYVFSDDTNELIATLSFFKMYAPEIVNPTSYWMRHMAYGMREEFGCSTDNIYFVPCNALVFIAVFFSFLVVIGFVFVTGYSDYQVVILGMIVLSFFGIVGWIPAYLLGLMWIITVFSLQSGGWSWRG